MPQIGGYKTKKLETKDKFKPRVKDLSKGTGFIKEEHKFNIPFQSDNHNPPSQLRSKNYSSYLNYKEADNLQDIINYVASIKNTEFKNEQITPIESLYEKALANPETDDKNYYYTNEKLDNSIATLLKNNIMDEYQKINSILDYYAKLLKMKNKNLKESTYIGLVELFIKNGYLNHASYFLCQMDRLKMDIPRSLLDLFLDYSISQNLFDEKNKDVNENEIRYNKNFNKYDAYSFKDTQPEYAYYYSKKNNFKNRTDMKQILSELKLDAKPFYPKKYEDEKIEQLKKKLNEIDCNNIKEFVPKKRKIEN